MDILEKIELVINEGKEFTFNPEQVPDAKLIKVGETFSLHGVQYEVTKWSKDEIKAVKYK